MKNIYIGFLFCIMTMTSHAQNLNFEWAKSVGSPSAEISKSINVSSSGDVYITGSFIDTVDFDPGVGTYNLISAGGEDIFVQKLDAGGNFIWAVAMGGLSNEIGRSIQIDDSGFVYVGGYFEGTADFDPGVATFNLTSNGVDDAFVLKLDSLGNLIWAKSVGGIYSDRCFSIATDIIGNVYATGKFRDTVDFDPGVASVSLYSSGGEDVFILKLNNNGDFAWVNSFEGSIDDEGRSITTDVSGNVFLTGNFEDTVDFDPGPSAFDLISNGLWDIFVTKLDSMGNFIWAKSFGGIDRDGSNFITIDMSGNIYIAGKFQSSVDFDPGAGTDSLTSNGDYDIFIEKLDVNGDFMWAKSIGGINYDQCESITTDASGNVYLTGYYQDVADFDPDTSIFDLTSAGAEDIFFLKLDELGNFIRAKSLGGALTDAGNAIAIDAFGNIYVSGYFQSTVDFDPGTPVFDLTSNGSEDIFVAKYSQTLTSINENSLFTHVSLFPNPNNGSVNIFLGSLRNVTVKVFSASTQLIYKNEGINSSTYQFDLMAATGIYFIEVSVQNARHYFKLVKN